MAPPRPGTRDPLDVLDAGRLWYVRPVSDGPGSRRPSARRGARPSAQARCSSSCVNAWSSEAASTDTLKAQGDAVAHRYLIDALEAARPSDHVLSEESADQESSATKRRTRRRRPGVDRGPPRRHPRVLRTSAHRLGGPRRPLDRGRCRLRSGGAARPQPRVLDVGSLRRFRPRPIRRRIAVSRTRPPPKRSVSTMPWARPSSRWVLPGRKPCRSSPGTVDIYPHSGGQYEWDSAAPVAVARAAGLWCSRSRRFSAFATTATTAYLPDLLICRPEHAPTILEVSLDTP